MPNSESRIVTILHISDLHFRVTSDFDRTLVLRSLLNKISEERQWHPDLVCCTGDLAFSGQGEEYELAMAFFDKLLSATRLEKKQLFVVPGNHDVDLSKLTDSHRKESKEFEAANYNEFLAKSNKFFDDKELLKTFLVKFNGLQQFLRTFLDRTFHESDAYYFAEIINTKSGLRVGIVGLNSAWLSEGKSSQFEYGRQLLGVRPLQKAFQELERLEIKRPVDLRVVMFHHPIEWLWEHERSQVREFLREKANLILQGHQDNPDQQFYDIGIGAKRALVLQEGPAYEGSHYPNRIELIRCEISHQKKAADVCSITFDSKSGLWVLDTATFAKQKRPDGHGYFILWDAEPRQREPDLDKESIQHFLEETAILAGKKVLNISAERQDKGEITATEGLHGLVTRADLESEKIILTRVLDRYPEAMCVSEESPPPQITSDLRFYIDPLDGTINYSKGIPYYSISIACQKGNKTLVGVTYDLGRDILYSSVRDGGICVTRLVTSRRKAISERAPAKMVSKTHHLSESLIITGWPYDEWREAARNLRYLHRVLKMARDVRRFGAASLDLTLVALGMADGYWETSIGGLWDILAGALLVREAGGICDVFQEPETGRVAAIATNGFIHDQLWEIVKDQFTTYKLFESFKP